jgi:uroporphyrinogen-III synthase
MQKTYQAILSTRPLNNEIIDEAAQQNIFIDCISFIEIEPVTNEELEAKIQKLATEKITVVFTSMNAVKAVKDHISIKPAWDIFSIGQTTKELITDFFGAENIVATANDANSLADTIIERNVQEVFFFCGDQRRDELPGKLKAKNIKVEEIKVYTTIPTAQKLSNYYDGILFFSPSAVESFFSVNSIDDNVVLFAIGNTTADAINERARNKVIIAEQPGKEALVRKMMAYFSKQKQVN